LTNYFQTSHPFNVSNSSEWQIRDHIRSNRSTNPPRDGVPIVSFTDSYILISQLPFPLFYR